MQFSSSVPLLIIIAGPTAVGKSGLALALSEQMDSVILSADSRQVYREFDIGTAKPSDLERRQVPHYLIDICDPTEPLTVADYQQRTQEILAQVHAKRRIIPLLVGGTGLYINAIAKGLKIPRVAPQLGLRAQLNDLGQPQCYAFLQQLDPVAAQRIHRNDQVRTLRALEVYYVTGQPISDQQGENPPGYPILYMGLDCDGLYDRIEKRTHQMIEMGLVEEVKALVEKYGAELPLLKTLGYAEIQTYLNGDMGLEDAIVLTVQHTRQFAKRQRTWFRKEKSIEWFDAECPELLDKVWQRVQAFLKT
ncbi:MAG: tRNA (adenosine(37)-N6)-dimethylallyltransferase MiaA [Cyanobacteria bacterium P01_D01_bin.44]